MKKLTVFLLCILLLTAGCSAPKDLPEILVTADGETLLTHQDLLFARAYEGISPKDKKDDEELFLRLAAQSVCAALSEEWGESPAREELSAEYEIYLQSVDTGVQADRHYALREELSAMTDEQFNTAFTEYLYRSAAAEALLTNIAKDYGNTENPQAVHEGILSNLWELSSSMEIRLYYPDIPDTEFDFEYAL